MTKILITQRYLNDGNYEFTALCCGSITIMQLNINDYVLPSKQSYQEIPKNFPLQFCRKCGTRLTDILILAHK